MKVLQILSVAIIAASMLLTVPSANAHSGGLNAQGCHAGSQPYHCHRPQVVTPQNSPEVKLSRTGICHARGSRYYQQTRNFIAYATIEECLRAGGRLPRN